jgi:large subunit ribosomal protein L30
MAGMLRVIQTRSAIGRTKDVRATLRGLGLTRLNRPVLVKDTESARGMIRKVQHLVSVEPER